MSAVLPAVRPLLSARRLKVYHPVPRSWPWSGDALIRAVDELHFNLYAGETLGIVGESGCGKSTLARTLVGLQRATAGAIGYGSHDLVRLTPQQWRPLRREIQMVFQDARAALDPRMTIGQSVEEPLRSLFPELGVAERSAGVAAMLERVGLADVAGRLPRELSGGQCQRAGIARALIVRPKILICDEPVSSLDVSVQAQVVNLLRELQVEYGLSMIFIAHDLAVVRHISHRVLVMYLGKVMEQAARDELFADPRHPYTRALLAAVPPDDPAQAAAWKPPVLEGELPSAAAPPSGCVFRTRCPIGDGRCATEVPYLRRVGATAFAACHYVEALPDPDEASRRNRMPFALLQRATG